MDKLKKKKKNIEEPFWNIKQKGLHAGGGACAVNSDETWKV